MNNGHYQDAQATVSGTDLRAWGQKDLANGRAHLWIQNKKHTWRNVVGGVAIPAVSGTVEVSGLKEFKSYAIEWWDPYQPDISRQIIRIDTAVARANGAITITVDKLANDIAVKITMPPLCSSAPRYDLNCDQRVDVGDLMLVAGRWGTRAGNPEYDARYDLSRSGTIDVEDLRLLAARWRDDR